MALGKCCCSLSACILAWAVLAFNSYARLVVLTNGNTETRHVSASEAAAAFDSGSGIAARISGVAMQDPSGGGIRSKRMFILSYKDEEHAKKITKALSARTARILSYIPEHNLLVSAKRDVAIQVAFEQGAELAEWEPRLKVAPELQPLMAESSGSKTTASDTVLSAPLVVGNMRRLAPDPKSMKTLDSRLDRYGILLELHPGIEPTEVQAMQQTLSDELEAELAAAAKSASRVRIGCRPTVAAPSRDSADHAPRLPVFLCREDLGPGLGLLSARPEVKFLAPLQEARTNNALAGILLQTGNLTKETYDNATLEGFSDAYMPYWAAGLKGQGEIIGVGDSGLDVEGCYFSDPLYAGQYAQKLAAEYQVLMPQGYPYVRFEGHRKVVQYTIIKANGSNGDALDNSGHGTSVCGSLAGAALLEDGFEISMAVDGATGAAAMARISFMDLSDTNTDKLSLPYNLDDDYLKIHKAAGAFIHSNSWGWTPATQGTYLYFSKDFDTFLWRNPTAICINPAGNDGSKVVQRSSVGEPSLAKNVVSVGAGVRMSPVLAGASFVMYKLTLLWKNGRTEEMTFYPNENRKLPLLSDVIPTGGQIQVVLADPLAACKSLRRLRAHARGAVLLVSPPTECNTYTQVIRAVEVGGVAIIVLRRDTSTLSLPSDPLNPDTLELYNLLPVSWVNQEWADYLSSVLANTSLIQMYISKSEEFFDPNTILHFSSSGPVQGGRIKPDITAPGYSVTTSAKSVSIAAAIMPDALSNSCRVTVQSGTSSAAPLVAGSTAIMRQYFRRGFYPVGSPKSPESVAFNASGILLKALIIAGAMSLKGGIAMAKGSRLGPPPDGYQGWGRMSLSGALPLEGLTDPRFRLQVVDWGSFSATGESSTLEGLTATGTGPVTVVMTYYDYPSEIGTGGTLVNNLDLVVVLDSGGRRVLGNNAENATKPKADLINTVERVLLEAPPSGTTIRIIVNATALPSSWMDPTTTQRWAVAVVGHFEGTLRSPLNPAWPLQRDRLQGPTAPPDEPMESPPPPPSPRPPSPPPRVPRRRSPASPPMAIALG